MRYSGNSATFRKPVLRKVLAKYETELSNHMEGKKPLYRLREERIQMKESNNLKNQKDTWLRSNGATRTLTVPATPHDSLNFFDEFLKK